MHKIAIFLWVTFIHLELLGQYQTGTVYSMDDKSPIGFVNIGIPSRNIGTVSDELGHFAIKIDSLYFSDSIKFSMIGYEAKTFLVKQFIANSVHDVYLTKITFQLNEIEVIHHRTQKIMLGFPITPNNVSSGWAYNDLGCEMGIAVAVKWKVLVNNINLNIASCTFDSVIYRLNIYELRNDSVFQNILTKPIYLSFSKIINKEIVTFDLSSYSISLKVTYLISLELCKDLGEGSLQYWSEMMEGLTYFRKTCEGKWHTMPGRMGMYLYCDKVK